MLLNSQEPGLGGRDMIAGRMKCPTVQQERSTSRVAASASFQAANCSRYVTQASSNDASSSRLRPSLLDIAREMLSSVNNCQLAIDGAHEWLASERIAAHLQSRGKKKWSHDKQSSTQFLPTKLLRQLRAYTFP